MKTIQNKAIKISNYNLETSFMTTDILTQYESGKFRMVVKTKLGMTVCDARSFENPRMMSNPESIISGYKSGALQTVQFCPDGSDFFLTIFSRTGKKVKLIDESILAALTVGTINSMYSNTQLMDMEQYKSVNSTSWASKAFTMNEAVAV